MCFSSKPVRYWADGGDMYDDWSSRKSLILGRRGKSAEVWALDNSFKGVFRTKYEFSLPLISIPIIGFLILLSLKRIVNKGKRNVYLFTVLKFFSVVDY